MTAFFDSVGYQQAYADFLAWCADPKANGIGVYKANPRTIDVMTPIVLLTTDSTGNNLTKPIFTAVSDTYKQRKTLNTLAPAFQDGGQVPNQSIFGIIGGFTVYDHEAGTAAQALNIRRILSGGNVRLDVNGQPKFTWHNSRMLNSLAAFGESSDGQAAPVSMRTMLQNLMFTWLPAPCLLTPGSKLSGEFTYDMGTVVGVETPMVLALHCFACDAGSN